MTIILNKANATHERKWWKEAVVYQIYPSSFKDSNGDGIGDIPGIISKLDYIKSLGVDVIWLSPHYKSPKHDMGYDISDYQDIDADYGTKDDCDRLIEEVHKRGMKLLFDLVVNHTSDEHPWFLESKSSLDNPKRDWYIWRKPLKWVYESQLTSELSASIPTIPTLPTGSTFGMNGRPLGLEAGEIEKQNAQKKKEAEVREANGEEYKPYPGEKLVPVPPCNWRAAFSGSVWEFDEKTQEFYLHLFCKQQPDLNWELPEVREAIYENAVRYWLDKGIDGFRIDTVNMYSKNLAFPSVPAIENNQPWQRADLLWSNGPRLHEFLREMNEKCFSKYDCMTVGECPNTPNFDDVLPFVSSEAKMLDMVFQFEIAIIDHGLDYRHMSRKWNLSEFKHYLNQFQASIHGTDGWTTNYLENHDQARSVSRFGSDAPEFRVVSGKMLCIYLMTLTGTTFVYQGEEIGTINAPISYPIEDYRDCDTIGFWADLRKASNDDPEILELGRRGAQLNARDQGRMPMQWDNSEQGGFTTAKEAWQKVNPYYKEINVAAQEEDPESVLSFYKQMINFRRAHRDLLVYGTFELLDMDNEQTVTYLKGDGDKQAIIALNFTKEIQPFTMPKGLKGVPKLALSNVEGSSLEQLRPFEGRIYFVNC